MDLSGPKVVESHGGKRYTLIVRDYFSRTTWVYFIRHKSNAAETFQQFLADTRAHGVPSQVVISRFDGGGELRVGSLGTNADRDASRRSSPRPTIPNSMR